MEANFSSKRTPKYELIIDTRNTISPEWIDTLNADLEPSFLITSPRFAAISSHDYREVHKFLVRCQWLFL